MSKIQKIGLDFVILAFVLATGALIGRSDIASSCIDLGTFTLIGVTYNCELQVNVELIEEISNANTN